MIYILSPTYEASTRVAKRRSLADTDWWHISGPNGLLDVKPQDTVLLHPDWSRTWAKWDTVHAVRVLRRLNVELLGVTGAGVL